MEDMMDVNQVFSRVAESLEDTRTQVSKLICEIQGGRLLTNAYTRINELTQTVKQLKAFDKSWEIGSDDLRRKLTESQQAVAAAETTLESQSRVYQSKLQDRDVEIFDLTHMLEVLRTQLQTINRLTQPPE